MQQVTVTFDLIFDLRRRNGSLFNPWRTTFSFTAGGVTHRDLSVTGWPTLQVGQTVTALLRKDGDWQTLSGWINHDNGEVVKPTSARTLRRASWLAVGVGALVLLLHGVLMLRSGTVEPGVKILVALLWAGYGVFVTALALAVWLRAMRRRREVRALEACLHAIERRVAASRPTGQPRTFESARRHAANN